MHNGIATNKTAMTSHTRTNATVIETTTIANGGISDSDEGGTNNESSETMIGENNVILERHNNNTCEDLNIKVKTPMCLVNELARHNHVSGI